jgi:hypothetical protein
MTTVRELEPGEHQKWNEFVESSPQGSVFQCLEWVQMLVNTDTQKSELMAMVCEEENEILGGIIIRYRVASGKRLADITPVGYNGPVLAKKLFNPEKIHTFKAYSILFDLLKGLEERVDLIVLENQPEIWDIRSFIFRFWQIDTAYTHVWESAKVEETRMQVHPGVQMSIESVRKSHSFNYSIQDADIEQFINLSRKGQQKNFVQLKPRIDWMREHQRCQMHFVADSKGDTVAMALVILSKENETAYLLNTVFRDKKSRLVTEPYLYWQSYLALAGQFSWINIGADDNRSPAHLKDNLGTELIPYFTTKKARL